MRCRRGETGQATVELVALLPLVLLLLAALWQLALAGQAIALAGSAARAAARARALGGDPARAARAVLPRTLEHGLRVEHASDGAVRVALAVPAVIGGGRVATVGARARFEPQLP